MRTLPAILLAALTAVAIAVSAFVTASHFGMRDWPTPPMPDTATRLITPTEAAAKARERLSKGDDASEVTIAGDAGATTHRAERPAAQRSTHRAGTRSHRAAPQRRSSTGRPSGERRSGNRNHGGDDASTPAGDDAATPAPSQPAAPPAGPSAPVAEASSGDQAQARPGDSATQPVVPAPSLPPVVPQLPTAPTPSSGHGPIRDLLGHLL